MHKKVKGESEVLGLDNWMEEMENARMRLEVGHEAGKADLRNRENIVTVSAMLGQRWLLYKGTIQKVPGHITIFVVLTLAGQSLCIEG